MVRFNLLENALDSVETGLDYFNKALEGHDRRDYKQCLLNLFQAAELLLKAVVSRNGSGAIFNPASLQEKCVDPAHPTESELHQCKSVNVNQLCKLLKTYYPAEFSESALQMMKTVGQLRNNLQHFALEVRPQELSMQLSELYQQIFRPAFVIIQSDETENSWNSDLRQDIIALEQQFLDITVNQEYTLALCPVCESFSHFILYQGESFPARTHCICCGFSLNNLQTWDFQECPECSVPSVIYLPEQRVGVCLWYKCEYSKMDGFVPMEPCECGAFRMEGHCSNCDLEE